MKPIFKPIALVTAALTPALALAHDEHQSSNLLAGIAHFFNSPDHLVSLIVLVAVAGYLMVKLGKAKD